MCGIVGIAAVTAPAPRPEQIARMCDVLTHRGPDDAGVEVRDRVGLGNRRLCVIDPQGGKQPMRDESGSLCVVHNGEIYNHRALRGELSRCGHGFRTESDTEVILHAYQAYGLDFPRYLNGMFAIALHDQSARRLIIVRDHLGIKPLYYAQTAQGHFIWGSEIKALLASGLLTPSLSVNALGQFLSWEYVPGEHTLMNEVKRLLPAHMLILNLEDGSSSTRRYWDVPQPEVGSSATAADWEAQLDETITRCVQRQLVSDVPLGAFLSGGVDSSLVVSAMGPAKVFSIGFDDPSYNELTYAKRVSAHLGLEHVTEVVRPDAADLFDLLMGFMDDPIGDFSIFPTYLIARLARRHVTVALSGDGGDELFGGYDTYLAQRYARWYQYLPTAVRQRWLPALSERLPPGEEKKGATNKLKRFVEGARYPASLRHARWRLFASDAMKTSLFTADARESLQTSTDAHIAALFDAAGSRSSLDQQLYTDLKSYLSDNCLVKVDRMSMANSLEVRVPLLDKEIVELAFQIPAALKISGARTKRILKRVAARHVPSDCVYRPKEGFSIPIKHWLKTSFRPLLEHYLEPARISQAGIFQAPRIAALTRDHFADRANHSHLLWSLIMFEAWKDRWLNGPH